MLIRDEPDHKGDTANDIAKLTKPSASNVLPRTRLWDQLNDARNYPLVWVSGPAGSGKTSLVSSYIDTHDLSCLWYRIDNSDTDLSTFFYYLRKAAENLSPSHPAQLPFLTPEYLLNISRFSRNFFDNLFSRIQKPAVIVLDNYHEIGNKEMLHAALVEGVSRLSEGINFIVLSRQPPAAAFSRLMANRQMGLIEWEDLRFTLDEFKQIITNKPNLLLKSSQVKDIYQLLNGWIAGLHLLLLTGLPLSAFKEGQTFSRDDIFNYFSTEAFDCLDSDLKEFLLITSLSPFLTPDIAEELTGKKNTASLLNYLYSNNIFTSKLSYQYPAYEYHDLFREFLLARLSKAYSHEKLCLLKRNTASLLIRLKMYEEAVDLLEQAEDVEGIVQLVIEQGESLIKQGRSEVILNWIQALPEDVQTADPWVLYWQGMAYLYSEPLNARPYFVKAYNRFKSKELSRLSSTDRMGLVVSWLGITDSYLLEICDFREVDHWIDELNQCEQFQSEYHSSIIEFRVIANYFGLLLFRSPQHRDMQFLAERLKQLAKKVDVPELYFATKSLLIHYYLWMGNYPEAKLVMDNLDALLEKHEVPLHIRLSSYVLKGNYFWLVGLFSEAHANSAKALALAEESGVRIWDGYFHSLSAFASLSVNNVAKASLSLEETATNVLGRRTMDEGGYYLLCGWMALLLDDFISARTFAEAALTNAIDNGFGFPIALSKTNLALVLFEIGETDQSLKLTDDAYEYACNLGSFALEFKILLARAYFLFRLENSRDALKSLKQAMVLGKNKGLVNMDWWRDDMMSYLCRKALEEKIEEKYVQDLIRKRKLVPKDPPLDLENWPWSIRIYTLGRFEIVLDGIPLQTKGKAKKKQMDFLKVLLSNRGREVSTVRIADTLWPDAEGDLQHRSLDTTLYRLRRLLGINESITLNEGKLELNDKYCWVDTWAFERLLTLAEALWEIHDKQNQAAEITMQALAYYQGPFLAIDSTEYWSMQMRERLRNRFIRGVCKLGEYLENSDRVQEAIECYLKCLDIEPLVETLYQQLIDIYSRLGREIEAIAVYNRCKTVFAEMLDVDLSDKTQKMFKIISNKS